MAKAQISKSKSKSESKSKYTCEMCKFFFRTKATNTIGECHYYPPLCYTPSSLNAFPRVGKDAFCGKYEDKPKKVIVGGVFGRRKTDSSEKNRVDILARELNAKTTAIIKKCREHNFDIKNHMSPVSPGLAGLIREWFGKAK